MMPARIGHAVHACPCTSASSALTGGSSHHQSRAFVRSPAPNGTISAATASAAGVLMTEAIRILPSAFGTIGARNDGVDHHHRAGDARHAAGHQREQFAALHPREVGADQQRRLDHADEDMHRRAQRERAADAHRPPQQPGERAR